MTHFGPVYDFWGVGGMAGGGDGEGVGWGNGIEDGMWGWGIL